MKRLGLLGCGNISKGIVKAINEGKINFRVTSLFDTNLEKAKELAKDIKPKPKIAKNIEEFLREVDIVFEGASQDAVFEYAEKILSKKKELVIMSVGALVNENFFEKLKKIAEKNRVCIYIPSGAILGVDGLKAAKISKCEEVVLTTRKNPKSFGLKNKKEKIIFEGSAKEAVVKFPRNINIAATLSLAGIGFKKTKVKIISDPKVKENIHEVYVRGNFGEFLIRTKNLPSLENPKTSYLAVLSAISILRKIESSYIQIGT
ncbi:MAG: aspartate dehydrogenase [Candidatus Altiarchaeota archaeon]